MKLVFPTIVLLALRRAAASDLGAEMQTGNFRCNFSFKLLSDTHEAPSYEESHVTQCLEDSYNEFHEPTKYSVDGVEVENTVSYEVPAELLLPALEQDTLMSDDQEWDFVFVLGIYSFVYGSFCDKWCDPREDSPFDSIEDDKAEMEIKDDYEPNEFRLGVESSHPHPEWELRFCSCLRRSDDSGLDTAFDCKIHRSDTAEQGFKLVKNFNPEGQQAEA